MFSFATSLGKESMKQFTFTTDDKMCEGCNMILPSVHYHVKKDEVPKK